jgi:hypothetical protein
VRFVPVTPTRLEEDLAAWINGRPAERPAVGFDGPTEIGTAALADAVALRLRTMGRPVIRVSTRWWWRPASLRLEFGRTDIDMLLSGWVDTAALRRELFDPLLPGGSGHYLPRLRDPETDRSLREQVVAVAPRAVVLLDGPFLQAHGLPTEVVVHVQATPGTIARSLPADRQWWVEGFRRYRDEDRPADTASVVVSYDHPLAPAVCWPDGVESAGQRAKSAE